MQRLRFAKKKRPGPTYEILGGLSTAQLKSGWRVVPRPVDATTEDSSDGYQTRRRTGRYSDCRNRPEVYVLLRAPAEHARFGHGHPRPPFDGRRLPPAAQPQVGRVFG